MPIPKRTIELWTKAAITVIGVVGGLYGILSFIDGRIEKKLTEEATLRKIAELVRPSCIFDERGSVLFDSGAMQAIETIKIEVAEKREESGRLPYKITIRPNRLLSQPPLLSSLDAYSLDIRSERGEKFDWVYTISYVSFGSNPDITKCRFRLEIL